MFFGVFSVKLPTDKKYKPKKCKGCGQDFQPYQSTQKVCSLECAKIHINQQAAEKWKKKERAELKAAKEKIKTRSQWVKEAQQAFNAYIRARDEKDPCISCQRYHNGQYHAGHYKTTGANPELRFEEDNCHKQCAPCNNHLSGNLVNYRINLITKLGIDRVERLEGPHDAKKYSIEELKAIKYKYKKKLKDLKEKQ